jgi:hypothetical protein
MQARSPRTGARSASASALPGTEVRPLGDSYHVATLDNDAPEIFDGSLAFIQKHSVAKQNG